MESHTRIRAQPISSRQGPPVECVRWSCSVKTGCTHGSSSSVRLGCSHQWWCCGEMPQKRTESAPRAHRNPTGAPKPYVSPEGTQGVQASGGGGAHRPVLAGERAVDVRGALQQLARGLVHAAEHRRAVHLAGHLQARTTAGVSAPRVWEEACVRQWRAVCLCLAVPAGGSQPGWAVWGPSSPAQLGRAVCAMVGTLLS